MSHENRIIPWLLYTAAVLLFALSPVSVVSQGQPGMLLEGVDAEAEANARETIDRPLVYLRSIQDET